MVNQDSTATSAVTLPAEPFGLRPIGHLHGHGGACNSPGAGTPTGTVTFEDGGIAHAQRNREPHNGRRPAGRRLYTTSALSVATHSITAVYNGNTNDAGSTASNTVSQVVNQDSTATTLTVPAESFGLRPIGHLHGHGERRTARGLGRPPARSRSRTAATQPNGSVNLTTVGGQQEATYTTGALSVGTHSITAVYNGDTNDAGSTCRR